MTSHGPSPLKKERRSMEEHYPMRQNFGRYTRLTNTSRLSPIRNRQYMNRPSTIRGSFRSPRRHSAILVTSVSSIDFVLFISRETGVAENSPHFRGHNPSISDYPAVHSSYTSASINLSSYPLSPSHLFPPGAVDFNMAGMVN